MLCATTRRAPAATRGRDQVARALAADAVVAGGLLLHLARVEVRRQVGQLVHDHLGPRATSIAARTPRRRTRRTRPASAPASRSASRALVAARHAGHLVSRPRPASGAAGGRSRRSPRRGRPSSGLPLQSRGLLHQVEDAAVSSRRLMKLTGPCQPGSVSPMSNRWLIVWSALCASAANSTGTRHAGRPTARAARLPGQPGTSRCRAGSGGRPDRSRRACRRTSPGSTSEPHADRELCHAEAPRSPGASALSVRRGPAALPLLPPLYEPWDSRRSRAPSNVTAAILGRHVAAARRPV